MNSLKAVYYDKGNVSEVAQPQTVASLRDIIVHLCKLILSCILSLQKLQCYCSHWSHSEL